ncbi:uncharacterized protein TNCV_2345121 [Trichonephila clavipes]|nr:uncharacterized protein TNCV_2345121 [Trichonephila clavipes]
MTPEMAPPLLTTIPHQREDVSALDRFRVHRCPTRRVFSGTRLELVTKPATIRYLYHSATAATCNGVFSEGPRKFEPGSSDRDDFELTPSFPNFHTARTGGRFDLETFNGHRLLCITGLQWLID